MKRLILLLLLLSTSAAFGQITITAAQFLAGYGSSQGGGRSFSSEDMSGVPALIATAGASQTWDFSGRTYTETPTVPGAFITVFPFPGTAPFASDPDFATTTHVVKTSLGSTDLSATWMYYRFTDQGFWYVGMAYDSMGTAKKGLTFVPPTQSYAFPLTYQTSWSSSSEMRGLPYPEGYVVTQNVEAKVDGYGSLVLPGTPSSTTEALRIETKNTQVATFQSVPISTTVTYDYEWITQSAYSGTITADGQKAPMSIGYTTPGTSGGVRGHSDAELQMQISANPAQAKTAVTFTLDEPTVFNVHVHDMLGSSVQAFTNLAGQQGLNIVPLTVEGLSAGTYFVRIDAGQLTTMKKLVVTR